MPCCCSWGIERAEVCGAFAAAAVVQAAFQLLRVEPSGPFHRLHLQIAWVVPRLARRGHAHAALRDLLFAGVADFADRLVAAAGLVAVALAAVQAAQAAACRLAELAAAWERARSRNVLLGALLINKPQHPSRFPVPGPLRSPP